MSALAISGMIFTFSCRRFINSISKGLSLKDSIRALQLIFIKQECTNDLRFVLTTTLKIMIYER